MVLLHSAFIPRSALGTLAFSAMAIVVLTGILGRYIYAHTPRSVKGMELELDDIRRDLQDYQNKLVAMGMPHDFFTHSTSALDFEACFWLLQRWTYDASLGTLAKLTLSAMW